MKKIIATLAALAATVTMVSAESKLSFYNKLFEDSAVLDHWDDYNNTDSGKTKSDFPALKERMFAEFKSDKVDALVKATFALDDDYSSTEHFALGGAGWVNDWYIEFRPVSVIALGMSTDIFPDGSYLPVLDDNVPEANIGSEGFTVSVIPFENLRIAVSTPFSDGEYNWLNGDVADDPREDDEFNVGIGAIFTHELFQLGASIQDSLDGDERSIGAYINMPGLFGVYEPLTVGAGLTLGEDAVGFPAAIDLGHISGDVAGDTLFNAYATIDLGKFYLAAEMLFNFGDDDYGTHDFYTGASLSFGLAKKLTATVTGKLLSDLTSSSKGGLDSILYGAFALDYEVDAHNSVGAEFDMAVFDSDWSVALPVYWKYTL